MVEQTSPSIRTQHEIACDFLRQKGLLYARSRSSMLRRPEPTAIAENVRSICSVTVLGAGIEAGGHLHQLRREGCAVTIWLGTKLCGHGLLAGR